MDKEHAPPSALRAGLRLGGATVARASGLYGLMLKGSPVPPPNLEIARPGTGSAEHGRSLLTGSFGFGGETVRLDGLPWDTTGGGAAWNASLNAFDWLDDIRAVDGTPARRRARTLVDGWIAHHGKGATAPLGAIAWRGDVTARRVWSWTAHFRYLAEGAEPGFADRMLGSLGEQARHLTRIAGQEDIGPGRLTSIVGLTVASLCFEPFYKWREEAAGLLSQELANAILADGAHASRSPAIQVAAIRDLIALRALYRAAHEAPPDALQIAIDRMAPATRFFRHGDGGLAHFNSTGEMRASDIDTILSLSEARGRPPRRLPHGGYERISAGKLLLLADAGAVPPARYDGWMHAAPFSFEVSWGADRLIVNCGAAQKREGPWATAQRATAAHAALTVADTNAIEIEESGKTGKRRPVTSVTRNENDEAVWLDMEHDGYRDNHGIVHRRRLYVDLAGNDLRGEDSLIGGPGKAFAIRFHLHPKVQVSLLSNHSAALLRTPGGTGWRLRASGADMTLSDSVYLSGQNPASDEVKRTQQVILTGVTGDKGAIVKWALQREKKR